MPRPIHRIVGIVRRNSQLEVDESCLDRFENLLEKVNERIISRIRGKAIVLDFLEPYREDFRDIVFRAFGWAYPRNVTDEFFDEDGDPDELIKLHQLIERARGSKLECSVQKIFASKKFQPHVERFCRPIGYNHLTINLYKNIVYVADYIAVGNSEMAHSLMNVLELWTMGWIPVGMRDQDRTIVVLTTRSYSEE